MVIALILKNAKLGQLDCAHISSVILQCILPVCGVPGVDMEVVCTE
jgi:hypothetical protein